MKRTILLVALVLTCVGVAGAQTIDPTIILNGGGGSQPVSTLTFLGMFTVPGALNNPPGNNCPTIALTGGGSTVPACFDGQNQTGFHWVALSITYTFTLANSTPLTITCMSNLFDLSNCARGVPVTITPSPTTVDPTGTVTLMFACSDAALASGPGCGITTFTPVLLLALDPTVSAQNTFVNYVDPNSAGSSDILDTTFSATAIVPEPGTVALFLIGLGGIVARRRLGKNCSSRS